MVAFLAPTHAYILFPVHYPVICCSEPTRPFPNTPDSSQHAKTPKLPTSAALSKKADERPVLSNEDVENLSLSKENFDRSVLDDVPKAIKLNAVVEAVAKRRDYEATRRVLAEMAECGVSLERGARAAILDASVDDHLRLADLLSSMSLPGYGRARLPSESPSAIVDPARAVDVSLAAGFLFVVSGALSAEFIEPTFLHRSPDDATAVLLLVGLVLAADRYGLAAAGWRRLRRGLTRLLANDPARAAHTDSAAFLVAYLLGLPWICYQPDGRRVASLHANVTSNPGKLSDDRMVDRCLVWLVAPVAAEQVLDDTLIQSDLGPARDFMAAVRKTKPSGKRMSLAEADNRIRCAISAAKRLLADHRNVHAALADAILSGASTGECVSLMVDRFTSS